MKNDNYYAVEGDVKNPNANQEEAIRSLDVKELSYVSGGLPVCKPGQQLVKQTDGSYLCLTVWVNQ